MNKKMRKECASDMVGRLHKHTCTMQTTRKAERKDAQMEFTNNEGQQCRENSIIIIIIKQRNIEANTDRLQRTEAMMLQALMMPPHGLCMSKNEP